MRAKDFLQRVGKIDRLILNKTDEIERWRTLAESTTAPISGDRVQSSSDQQKMANAVINMVTIEDELTAEIDQLKQARRDVIAVIEKLNANQYDIMHKIYIQGMTFQQVADLKGRTRGAISNMHRKAIKNVQAILGGRDNGKVTVKKRVVGAR